MCKYIKAENISNGFSKNSRKFIKKFVSHLRVSAVISTIMTDTNTPALATPNSKGGGSGPVGM